MRIRKQFIIRCGNVLKCARSPNSADSPIVGQLQRQSSMVSSLNSDDIRTEIRPKEEAQGFDDIWAFRFTSRQTQLSELFIWAEQDQLWSIYNSRMDEQLRKLLRYAIHTAITYQLILLVKSQKKYAKHASCKFYHQQLPREGYFRTNSFIPGTFFFVIIDLYCCIMRYSIRNNPRLVTFHPL